LANASDQYTDCLITRQGIKSCYLTVPLAEVEATLYGYWRIHPRALPGPKTFAMTF